MTPAYPHVLISEGGGMRNVFAAGVLDRFMETGFDPFDLVMGVSSGAGSAAAFTAKMPGRNLLIYTGYSLDPRFISIKKCLKGGHLMDLDWMWEKTIAEIRLDLKNIYAAGRPFLVVLTDVKTGRAVYKVTSSRNLEAALKASSAVPLLYRGFPKVDGRPFTDGGIADPIPVQKALDLGARKIMVIRSRPASYRKKERLTQVLLPLVFSAYPNLAGAAGSRVDRYNAAVALMRSSAVRAAVIEVCPPESVRLGRLCRNRSRLIQGYELGRAAGDRAIKAWNQKEKDG